MRPNLEFLSGGGEMGERMRAADWASSPIGSPDTWPQSLRVTIRLMLNTRHPVFIWWGPDLIQFYNDAYMHTMGPERHPDALGARGRDCWQEIWDIIGPQIQFVMDGKGSTWDEDRLVPVTRHGRREDVWWTYSYSPIDMDGTIGGVLVICNDVTKQHLATESLKDQQRRIMQLFEQAPGFMAVMSGPEHVFELTNAAYRQLINNRDVIGKPLADALPEVVEQGFVELLDRVYASGEAHVGRRVPLTLMLAADEAATSLSLDFVYQPIMAPDGRVTGVFVEGHDVTDHVMMEEHLQLMNDELKHRVKNTLAIVSALASQSLRGGATDAKVASFQSRLATFAKAHDILTTRHESAAKLREIISVALAPHSAAKNFTMNGPDVIIGAKQALSLSLALHELATNAVKYGALSSDKGHVDITWSEFRENECPTFRLVWTERGGPPVEPPKQSGFGSLLIKRVLTADFNGNVDVKFDPAGLTCELITPIENLRFTAPATYTELNP